jgi:hypothetical protein
LKPVPEAISSSAGIGGAGALTEIPPIVPLRPVIVVEPVAELRTTVEVELMSSAVISMCALGRIKEKAVADPVAVPMEGKVELALADTSVMKPIIGKLTVPEFVDEYDGGAVPEAGNAGPIVIGIPEAVAEITRPVAELEIVLTAGLAGETPSGGKKPTDRANAPIVAKADVLNAIILSRANFRQTLHTVNLTQSSTTVRL